ncbi:hypothetical protein [Gelidibacter salicanalis]|uniref:Uncharacterized protein n=1 Tax=Gelidibacter salicanalis TaxID=291193 RepID=A0A934NKD5_9FLAO|nr:hypothetical protein [Gelidibacter salicanalis]MBJ7880022.1 hypothetical protein [Gelidibacter salicanalis]
MKNKIINLFENKTIIQNQGIKYAQLLEQFIEPFANEFQDSEYMEDILEFAINAWNLGNMKALLPEGESDASINSIREKDINVDLLSRMIDYKIEKFKEYSNFIVDYELKETSRDHVLSVITQPEDAYLSTMFNTMDEEFSEEDFEENLINRSAIILKPLQPFFDWCSNLYPDEIDDMKETNMYLISEDIEDVEGWLKKKFDKLFMLELEAWHTNKKEWPQKRNYKMFKQWFQVDISTMIFDLEKEPVSKY